MKRALLLAALLLTPVLNAAGAVAIKLRPQSPEMRKLLQDAINALSTKDFPVTLDTSSGPLLALGGSVPFNPDLAARVVLVGGERRIEFNPQGPLPMAEAIKQELMTTLGLKEWTNAAARTRFSGADLNGDGKIDLTDLALLMNNYGKSATQGDLNQDGKVDDADLKLFSQLYKP